MSKSGIRGTPGRVAGGLLYPGAMYLSLPILAAWLVVTLGVLAFAIRVLRAQHHNLTLLRRTKRTLQKLESKNGKLWVEVMKSRSSNDYRSSEVTLTNVNDL